MHRMAVINLTNAGLVLFFLSLFVPTAYMPIKAVLLGVLLCGVCVGLLRRKLDFQLHASVLAWAVVLVATGAVFIGVGYVNDAPGALRVSSVYLLWPVLFTVFVALLNRVSVRRLLAVLGYASVALGLYGATYIGHEVGWLADSFYVELDQGQAIGLYDGFVEYNMYSIAGLIFLVPFLFSGLLHWRDGEVPLARPWLWLGYALCLALALLSGRRALWGILLVTPMIYFCFAFFRPTVRQHVLRGWGVILLTVGVLVATGLLFDLSPQKMLTYFLSSVSSVSSESLSLRHLQAVALYEGWLESPWFGHGHGAVASVIRSEEMPWAYELTYLALLFHTGIAGTLVYAACIGWVYWQGLRVIRESSELGSWMVPVLVGLTAFLIVNATNPYLAKFDFMWVVFLPLAIINRHLLARGAAGGTA